MTAKRESPKATMPSLIRPVRGSTTGPPLFPASRTCVPLCAIMVLKITDCIISISIYISSISINIVHVLSCCVLLCLVVNHSMLWKHVPFLYASAATTCAKAGTLMAASTVKAKPEAPVVSNYIKDIKGCAMIQIILLLPELQGNCPVSLNHETWTWAVTFSET